MDDMIHTCHGGKRVIRGPGWKWGNQDGGKGHVGTVITPFYIKNGKGPYIPSRNLMVQWDNGSRGIYRAGYEDSICDLRILDNVFSNWRFGPFQGDFHHSKIWCDGCDTEQIYGLRWRCIECFGVDLCSDCYMSEKHDITHQFMRVGNSVRSSMGPKMPPRSTSRHWEVKGLFPGARVLEYPCKSTESDNHGSMKVIKDNDPFREPRKGRINVRCRGEDKQYERKRSNPIQVPVTCTLEASGGFVYVDHLPVIASHRHKGSKNYTKDEDEDDIEESYGDYDDMFPGNVFWRAEMAYQGLCTKQNKFKSLISAVRSDNVKAVRKILNKHPEWVHYKSSPGVSLICYVAARGSKEMLDLLLERGAKIESQGVRRMTPLMISTIFRADEKVKYLLEKGANVEAESQDTVNSLYVACAQRDRKCTELLLQHGADVNASGYGTMSAFQESCRRDRNSILDMFLERKDTDYKATADLLTKAGTCLHVAVEAKNAYAVSKIIERVPKIVDVQDLYDQTPLIIAAQENASKCAEILIKMGRCNVNPIDPEDGESALTKALRYSSIDVVKVLIENGADINMAPKTGKMRSLDAAMSLRAHKPDGYGYFPFLNEVKEKWKHVGVETDGDALLAYLIDHGASLHPQDNDGIPPPLKLLLLGDPLADNLYDIWPPTKIFSSDEEEEEESDEVEMYVGRLAPRKRGRGSGSSQHRKKYRVSKDGQS